MCLCSFQGHKQKSDVLTVEEEKAHLKGEFSQARRGTGDVEVTQLECWGKGVFKTGLLHIHLGRHGLTVLIDSASYLTIGSIVHVFPIIQSVIIRCI